MMRKYGELMATVGEFTDSHGRKQKRRQRVGVVMRDDVSGKLAIRIELIPITPEWSGWLSVVRSSQGQPPTGERT